MATIKNAPNQPYLDTSGKWDWELEETLVDKQKRLPNRIRSMFRRRWLWMILLGIVFVAMLDANFMTSFLNILGTIIPLLLFMSLGMLQFFAMMWFVSRSRMYEVMPGTEGISFDDYRGQPELLDQAKQIVTLLRGVKAFEGSGGEPLNGLLLEGPPGTGKTWLAKAISTEAGVPFFYVDTSSLQGTFVGTGELKVSRMYGRARKAAKEYGAAVVFLDEIDSVGSRGGVSGVGGNNGPQDPMGGMMGMGGGMGVLSTLLIEMSGFGQEHGWRARLRSRLYRTFLRRDPPRIPKRVLTIGATNRMGALDAALLRPGRFDKKIRVDVPDTAGRRDIIDYYLSKMAHDNTMDPAILATETPGYSPADIKYVLNESLRYALFDGRRYITYRDFRVAQPEHEMGLRSPLKHIAPEARKRIAYYHVGQAVAVRLFQPTHRIARISIIRQGQAFGHVAHYPAREAYQGMMTKMQLLDRLKVLVAGRAAEIEFCGINNQTVSINVMGSASGNPDLVHSARIRDLMSLIARAGMLGHLGGSAARAFSAKEGLTAAPTPEMAKAMDELLQQTLNETREALRKNSNIVNALVNLLLEKEELLADEVRAFFDEYGLHTPDPTGILNGEEVSLLPPKADAPQLSQTQAAPGAD